MKKKVGLMVVVVDENHCSQQCRHFHQYYDEPATCTLFSDDLLMDDDRKRPAYERCAACRKASL